MFNQAFKSVICHRPRLFRERHWGQEHLTNQRNSNFIDCGPKISSKNANYQIKSSHFYDFRNHERGRHHARCLEVATFSLLRCALSCRNTIYSKRLREELTYMYCYCGKQWSKHEKKNKSICPEDIPCISHRNLESTSF